VLALGALLGWQWLDSAPDATGTVVSQGVSAPGFSGIEGSGPATSGGAGGPFSAAGLAARKEQLVQWQQRYDRAEQVYSSYKDSTRYPYESRPISEHPDQIRPFDPISEDKVLRDASGKAVKGLRLRTKQERVFLSGSESVTFTIEAFDDQSKPVPMTISRSAAQNVADTSTPIKIIEANVPFSDDGSGADITAGDGKYTARLTPATQGFANHAGTIRVLAQVTANGEQGVASFDVVYSPEVPATWLGVRDAVESGSLNFYLKVQVQVAGRYVASGRVYDANGKPFALVQFNEDVAVGVTEFKLQVFGALLRDKNPPFPLQLVDVDGFLLRPDAFPDRSMMARQTGAVYTTGRYAIDRFSAAEWSSEERDRYLKEYGRDVQEALEQVGNLQTP
jgi:hypothetical protein